MNLITYDVLSAYYMPGIIPGTRIEDLAPGLWGAYKWVGATDIGTTHHRGLCSRKGATVTGMTS